MGLASIGLSEGPRSSRYNIDVSKGLFVSMSNRGGKAEAGLEETNHTAQNHHPTEQGLVKTTILMVPNLCYDPMEPIEFLRSFQTRPREVRLPLFVLAILGVLGRGRVGVVSWGCGAKGLLRVQPVRNVKVEGFGLYERT